MNLVSVTEISALANCQWNHAIYNGKFNAGMQRRGCSPLPSRSICLSKASLQSWYIKSDVLEKETWRSKVKLHPFASFHLRWKLAPVNIILDISRVAFDWGKFNILVLSNTASGELRNILLWTIQMTSLRSRKGTEKIVKERVESSLSSRYHYSVMIAWLSLSLSLWDLYFLIRPYLLDHFGELSLFIRISRI